MAVQSKSKTTRTVASRKKQNEGRTAQTGEESDRRTQVAPDSSKDRGIGSSFAYAVGEMLTEAKEMKGSQSAFLGVPSETIDPKSYAQSLKGK
jgi:hypothetical protein